MRIQDGLNLISIVAIIIVLQFYRYSQRLTNIICDKTVLSSGDYTIMVKNIPNNMDLSFDYDEELKNFFTDKVYSERKTPVAKVNLSYNLQIFNELKDEKNRLIKKKQERLLKLQKKPDSYVEESNENFIEINKKISDLENEFIDGKSNKFVGIAFVSFEKVSDREFILKSYKTWNSKFSLPSQKKKLNFTFYGKKIIIEPACDPSDVYWENLHYTDQQKFTYQLISIFLSLLLLAVSFIGLYFLTYYQIQQSQKNLNGGSKANKTTFSNIKVKIIALIVSVGISVINVIMSMLIRFFVLIEKSETRTVENLSMAFKLAWAQFINTALINFLTNAILSNYYGAG